MELHRVRMCTVTNAPLRLHRGISAAEGTLSTIRVLGGKITVFSGQLRGLRRETG